MEHLL